MKIEHFNRKKAGHNSIYQSTKAVLGDLELVTTLHIQWNTARMRLPFFYYFMKTTIELLPIIISIKYFFWILIVATVPIATTVYQLILFGTYFSMYNVKHSQVVSCLIRLNAYFHNTNFRISYHMKLKILKIKIMH